MKPIEFILWMNGAAGVVGENPPTPEQWANMREKLGEAVGSIVASKLLEEAEEVHRHRERMIKEMEAKQQELEMHRAAYMAKMVNSQAHIARSTGLHDLNTGLGPASGTITMGDVRKEMLEKAASPSLLGRLMGGISVKASTS